MKKCSVGSAFSKLIVTTPWECISRTGSHLCGPRPVSEGNSAQGWRGGRPSSADPGPAPGSCLSAEGRLRWWHKLLGRDFPSNPAPPSSQPVTFAMGPERRPALATALATVGLLPPVSPGKRSAALVRDHSRARALGSGRAEDAWSCARTRELCRSESHSDPLLPVIAPLWGRVAWLEPCGCGEWTHLGRALTEVVPGVACERDSGPCVGACIWRILRAPWEKGFRIFL